MTYARRKTPNGVEPAYENAPPRLRQSEISEPFGQPMSEPSLLQRLSATLFGAR